MPAMCGVAKLLPVARMRAALQPREVEVEPAPEELDRRRRVVVEGQRVGLLVAADRDDAREAPREALHRHVVGRGDEEDALEVGAVGELVQPLDVLRARRREAHVHDREPLLDRPRQARAAGSRRRPCSRRRARARSSARRPARARARRRRRQSRARRGRPRRPRRPAARRPRRGRRRPSWSTRPTSGWSSSMPLSRMQTRTPAPVEPPHAHSRVTCSGSVNGTRIRSTASAGRLQAGRSSSSSCSWCSIAALIARRSSQDLHRSPKWNGSHQVANVGLGRVEAAGRDRRALPRAGVDRDVVGDPRVPAGRKMRLARGQREDAAAVGGAERARDLLGDREAARGGRRPGSTDPDRDRPDRPGRRAGRTARRRESEARSVHCDRLDRDVAAELDPAVRGRSATPRPSPRPSGRGRRRRRSTSGPPSGAARPDADERSCRPGSAGGRRRRAAAVRPAQPSRRVGGAAAWEAATTAAARYAINALPMPAEFCRSARVPHPAATTGKKAAAETILNTLRMYPSSARRSLATVAADR